MGALRRYAGRLSRLVIQMASIWQRRCPRLLPVRPPLPRWRDDQCSAVAVRKERPKPAVECWHAAAVQRHQIGRGPEFTKACESSLEGIISKRADAPIPAIAGCGEGPCQNREEFVVHGWTDPGGFAARARGAAPGVL